MAPKKKKYRGPKSSSPNVVIIVFLAFFVIVSLALGLTTYAGFAGQAYWEEEAKKHNQKIRPAQEEKDFYAFLMREARAAIGGPLKAAMKPKQPANPKNGNAPPPGMGGGLDEHNLWVTDRENYLAGTKFGGQPNQDQIKQWIQMNSGVLGFDKTTKNFTNTYAAQVQSLKAQLATAQAQIAKEKGDKEDVAKQFSDYKDAYEKWKTAFNTETGNKHKKVLDAALLRSKELDDLLKQKNDMVQKLQDQKLQHSIDLKEKDKLVARLVRRLENAEGEPAQPGQQPQPNKGGGETPHALLLDVSGGKSLWDRPRGKITRVIPKDQKVYINLGSADGVKPELTFNIFGQGVDGFAFGSLKGTLEVQEVIDENTSVARITTLFTPEGDEVPVFDPRRGAARRRTANPIKKGDLLYNMFWNSRVALAGRFSLTDRPVFSAAQDLEFIKQIKRLMENQGIKVDAYVDPTDRKVKGRMRFNTEYLIVGAKIPVNKTAPPDIQAFAMEMNQKRAEMMNAAVQKGMFIISAINFANVIGYRPPRSADSTKVSSFRARPPRAGRLFEKGQRPGPNGIYGK